MKTAILFGSLSLAAGLLAAIGCSSSSSTAGTGGKSTTSSTATSTTSTTTATSTGTSMNTPTCADYCTAIMKNCTGGDGSMGAGGAVPNPANTTQQYSGMDQCLASCKAFPVGTAADTSGNTLGCRLYHAGAAAMDAKTHCPHAGPSGDGTCGATCDGYCQIAQMYCTTANMAQVYTDAADCQAQCKATKDDVRFNIGVQDGDHVSCLVYHVQEGSVAPVDHCLGDLKKDPAKMGGSVTCQ